MPAALWHNRPRAAIVEMMIDRDAAAGPRRGDGVDRRMAKDAVDRVVPVVFGADPVVFGADPVDPEDSAAGRVVPAGHLRKC